MTMKIKVTKFKNVRGRSVSWTLIPREEPYTVTRECGKLAIEAGVATEVKPRKSKNPAPSPASADNEGEGSPEKKEQ